MSKVYILLYSNLIVMKVTIDTKEDSHHEIRKAIRLLMSLVGDNPVLTNEDETPQKTFDPPTETGGIFGAMFGGDAPQSEEEEKKPEPQNSELEFF